MQPIRVISLSSSSHLHGLEKILPMMMQPKYAVTIDCFEKSTEFLAALAQQDGSYYNAVITAVMIDMDVLDLIHYIRSELCFRNTIIVFSGHLDAEVLSVLTKEAGADYYIRKPDVNGALMEAISKSVS